MTVGSRIGICIAHNFPSLYLKKYYDEIVTITEDIIESFGFKNGPVYFQYLIGSEGIMVNEIAMRIGGAYEDVTMPMISGVDSLSLLIDSIKGQSSNYECLNRYDLTTNNVFLSTQMFFLKAGRIDMILIDEDKLKMHGTDKISISFKAGDEVETIKNATARAGYFITKGNGFRGMMNNVDSAYDELAILNDSDENMVIRYSDYIDRYKFVKEEDF